MTAEAVGFVVAGGASRRMGRDKALLPWGEGTLLDHALARLRAVCADVRILAGAERRYEDRGAPVHLDRTAGQGPLGALATALEASAGRTAVFLGVDLPFVPAALLRALLARKDEADAVVPVSNSGPEPLCGVYGSACASAVATCLETGERKMTAFWPFVRVKTLSVVELGPFGDEDLLFRNVNTPDDYGSARTDPLS